jgi:hypothetical protein
VSAPDDRYNPPAEQWVADVVVRFAVLVNSSTNFLVYCMLGTK